MPAPTGALIFDMDGVLLDSGAWHRAAWVALLTELGQSPPQQFREVLHPSPS